MGRTNIEIDDGLIAEVMERYDLRTKREAVDFALRRLVGPVMTRAEMLSMEGTGWESELTTLRRDEVPSM